MPILNKTTQITLFCHFNPIYLETVRDTENLLALNETNQIKKMPSTKLQLMKFKILPYPKKNKAKLHFLATLTHYLERTEKIHLHAT